MLLSIVIPVYNGEKYLEIMVNSLLSQGLDSFELLLVDDGSTDQSGSICDQIGAGDSRVRVFHIPNGGVSAARNLGLQMARGEYVHFADADDFVLPGMYSAFARAALESQADVLVCGVTYSRMNVGKIERVGVCAPYSLCGRAEISSWLDGLSIPLRRVMLNYIWNKWYRRTWLLKNHASFSVELSLGEDFVFNCGQMQRLERLEVLPGEYYCYQIRGDGATGVFRPEIISLRAKYRNAIQALYEYFGIWEANKASILMEEGRRCFGALCSVNSDRCDLSAKDKRQFVKQVWASPLMPLAMEYLKLSSRGTHRLIYWLIRIGGSWGAYFAVFINRLYRRSIRGRSI